MRKLFAWLGVATCVVVLAPTRAEAQNVLKPYVVFMLDTSGSMDNTTNAGPPSCGGLDNRLNHARCAINRIVNSYGDMVFALGRFRETPGGNYMTSCDANGNIDGFGGDQCTSAGVDCQPCGCNGRTTACGAACTPAMRDDARGELLTGLVDGNNAPAAAWTDFVCGNCGSTPIQNTPLGGAEIWGAGSWTPLGGFLASAHRYWQGLQATGGATIFPSTSAGFDPIRNDPTRTAFLPTGCDSRPGCTMNCCTEQCRPYITIMLTDGAETCGGNAVPVAQGMLQTDLATSETNCTDAIDDENDGFINDGCPAMGPAESGANCNNNVDNDGDGRINDGCPAQQSRYRIETKVIGFGITPGNADIEAYAQAGGAVDIPGANEGFYANNEAELQLAISQILADAIKVESCNNIDDDCDTRVDEDFLPPLSVPGKGGACTNGQLGNCSRPGTLVCSVDGSSLECNAPVVTPGTEVCGNGDDDCDGRIDEGLTCTPCVPVGETCNNLDDDCDGVPDQICRCSNDNTIRCDGVGPDCPGGSCVCTPLTQGCANTVAGVGSCPGTETCVAGTYQNCNAPTPTAEQCNGLDDDCDGNIDGFQLECSTIVSPDPNSGPGTDNPGHPTNNPIPQNICRPGTKTCPLNGSGTFGNCSGEIKPCNGGTPCPLDPCNGLDDDCDNLIDEDFVPADCSGSCITGQTVCVNGNIMCNGTQPTLDPTCNNVDEDCDGTFDEDWMCDPSPTCTGPACCTCGTGTTCEQTQCVNGVLTCVANPPINVETCNCLDDNCNGMVDENVTCSGGGQCVNCQCATPCTMDEFPCPVGKRCEMTMNGNFCVNDPCFGVMCPAVPDKAQSCRPNPAMPNQHECVDTCVIVGPSCSPGFVCFDPVGECRPNNCTTFPSMCSATESCVNGNCVANPCQGVSCPSDKYCVGGTCVSSCADVNCPAGQRCRQGACEPDPCGKACPFGQACNDSTGECIEDPCKFRECPSGQWCNPNSGLCEDDACVESGVTCPNEGEICRGGTCVDPDDLRPDAGNAAHVTVGGGGGCSTGGGAGLVLVLGVLFVRRRRAAGGAL